MDFIMGLGENQSRTIVFPLVAKVEGVLSPSCPPPLSLTLFPLVSHTTAELHMCREQDRIANHFILFNVAARDHEVRGGGKFATHGTKKKTLCETVSDLINEARNPLAAFTLL